MIELLVTVAIVALMSAMAVPVMSGARRRAAVAAAQREVAGQIRAARFAAITSNKIMRVRFACPAAGQYRVIELTGVSSIDTDSNRCSYPWQPDSDPATVPNFDGPIMNLPEGVSFAATQNLEISTRGIVTVTTGSLPGTIQVTDGSSTFTITASASGRIQTP